MTWHGGEAGALGPGACTVLLTFLCGASERLKLVSNYAHNVILFRSAEHCPAPDSSPNPATLHLATLLSAPFPRLCPAVHCLDTRRLSRCRTDERVCAPVKLEAGVHRSQGLAHTAREKRRLKPCTSLCPGTLCFSVCSSAVSYASRPLDFPAASVKLEAGVHRDNTIEDVVVANMCHARLAHQARQRFLRARMTCQHCLSPTRTFVPVS